jgi:MFS family permease
MLASIHPLGERGRNSRWTVTMVAYVVGSAAGGALMGLLFGGAGAVTLGWLAPPTGAVLAAAALVVAAGLALDLGLGGLRLPTIHRQVDEDWLHRYRGWVYGVGFGFQLGLGVVTIVTTATVYGLLALAFLAGSVAGGVLIGATFGLVRALPLLTAARVHDPEGLRRLHRGMQERARVSRTLSLGAQAVVVVAVALAGGIVVAA